MFSSGESGIGCLVRTQARMLPPCLVGSGREASRTSSASHSEISATPSPKRRPSTSASSGDASGGATSTGALALWSRPGSGFWKDAVISKITRSPCLAITRRLEKVRPSRITSTSKSRAVSVAPGRRK